MMLDGLEPIESQEGPFEFEGVEYARRYLYSIKGGIGVVYTNHLMSNADVFARAEKCRSAMRKSTEAAMSDTLTKLQAQRREAVQRRDAIWDQWRVACLEVRDIDKALEAMEEVGAGV